MKIDLSLIDQVIIVGYFVLITGVGLFMSRLASQGINNYFLGGKTIPWWILGASGTASNFDMTGTMVVVSFIYMLGLEGYWVTMRGGAVIPLAFLMVYMGKWYRRSGVMTEAEFLRFRFGEGRQGRLARTLAAVAYVLMSIGMVVYFSVGTGTFLSQYLPFSKEVCSLIMIAIGLAYTVSAGLYGVVFTDFLQEILMIVVAVYLAIRAFVYAGQVELPSRFTEFGLSFTKEIEGYEIYHMFTYCVVFWLLKGVLEGTGGVSGYMSQRYYAAKNEREAGLLTAEWIVLLGFRWIMIAGVAVLGVSVADQVGPNPENVLPVVLKTMLPDGMRGLALAGLIAAAMSTFDSTINAGASYVVKDLYQPRNPEASPKQLMTVSYAASLGIAVVGVFLSFAIPNINTIWDFMTASLGVGMFVPTILRWYWGRFNGYGYAIGVFTGMGTAMILRVVQDNPAPYQTIPIIAGVSLVGCIAGTLTTAPVEEEVRENFVRTARVGGFWGDIKAKLGPGFVESVTREHLNDLMSVILALPAQLCFFFACMCLIVRDWPRFVFSSSVVVICCIGLYFFWYQNLPESAPEGEGLVSEKNQE